jgi:hypothetical protein
MKPAKGMFSKKLNVKRLQMSVESHEKIDKKQFANAKAMALEARQVERKKKAVRQAERIRIRRTEQHRRKLEQAEGDMVERAKERAQRAEERLRKKEEKKLAAKLEMENDLRVQRHTEEERLRREKKVRAELPPSPPLPRRFTRVGAGRYKGHFPTWCPTHGSFTASRTSPI